MSTLGVDLDVVEGAKYSTVISMSRISYFLVES